MKLLCCLILSSLCGLLSRTDAVAQAGSDGAKGDTTYRLKGDTLFSNQDFKIFVGQRVIVGKASDEQGWYRSISFKSGASWPLLFLKGVETEQNLEYQMDPTIREKDKVKQYLTPGDTLTITKIKRYGKQRPWNWYVITIGQKQGPLSLNFKCDLHTAIKHDELIFLRD